ncbi:MAG: acyltransferase family protein [Chitinophagaceae bacterium]
MWKGLLQDIPGRNLKRQPRLYNHNGGMKKIYNYINDFLFEFITPGLFRFLLAFVVVIYHSVDFLTIGHYAVYVFFMLSGYWIFRMYNEKYSTYKNSYYVYICSRLARLMPLYWLILLVSLIAYTIPTISQRLAGLEGQGWTIAAFNFLALGLANSPHQFIGTAWSLDIEIQFYIIAPLLLLLCRKGFGWPLLVAGSLLSLLLVFNHYISENLVIYLPYFVIGGLIYCFNIQAGRNTAIICMLLLLAILCTNYVIPGLRTDYLLNRKAEVFGFNYREGLNVILAILTVPFLTVNVRQVPKKEMAASEQVWSSMSYVVYLLHWPLLLVYSVCVAGVSGKTKVIYLSIFYILCIGLSYLIAKYIDAHFEKRRRTWIGKMEKKQELKVSSINS